VRVRRALVPLVALTALVAAAPPAAAAGLDLAAALGPRDACLVVRAVEDGAAVVEHGGARCGEPHRVCSTLKVPLAALAFEHGLFASPGTPIPWDGRPQGREAIERDLTPASYLELSANWVSARIVERLGAELVNEGLAELFPEGGALAIGDPASGFVEAPVELAPEAELAFWRRLWRGELPLRPEAAAALRASLPRYQAEGLTVWGKTGSCCLDPGCQSGPARQVGWFVGVAEPAEGADPAYVFALQFDDREPSTGYAGATARDLVLDLLPRLLPR
jgi:beta-lactamase class D